MEALPEGLPFGIGGVLCGKSLKNKHTDYLGADLAL